MAIFFTNLQQMFHMLVIKYRIGMLPCMMTVLTKCKTIINKSIHSDSADIARIGIFDLFAPVTLTLTLTRRSSYTNLTPYSLEIYLENAFPILKVSRLLRVHTDSHHNGHNKMIFPVSYV